MVLKLIRGTNTFVLTTTSSNFQPPIKNNNTNVQYVLRLRDT
jgi:hypothetical protein